MNIEQQQVDWETLLKCSENMIKFAKAMVEDGDILNGKHTVETTLTNLNKEKYLNCPVHIESRREQLESNGNIFII
jgi:hypothetical protein